ncbi:LemA family protein [Candidatus Woesearchaeota archaeon]|nr:LemA family protein [Candidatus Woesearchaeota archaeon]
MAKAKEVKEEPKKKLSTGWIIGIVAIALIVLIVLSGISIRNNLVRMDTNVDAAWANVQVQYQRRADLIPNLVETVKGAKDFEQSTLLAVTEARNKWTNAKTPEEQVAAANQLDPAIKNFIDVVVEAYPDIKSTQNFIALQDELANTENKVAVERGRYNIAVKDLNTQIRLFPTNIVAGMFGFKQRTFFNAESGAENAPQVEF